MENEFTKVMSERSNEELIKIVTVDTSNYNATAIEAAHSEIEKRAINTSEFEELKEKATLVKTQEVKTSSVDSGVRLLNFTIDFIVWLIIVFIGSFIIEYFIAPSSQSMISFLIYALIFGTYLAYYAIMELKFQKTVGKFITKTKVVKLNGEKPKSGEIINRTFCRLIPFDRISFVFTNNGFHDYVSKTKVVKDSAVKEY